MELFCLEHILFMVVIALIMGLSIFLILKFVPKEKMFIPIKILATIRINFNYNKSNCSCKIKNINIY